MLKNLHIKNIFDIFAFGKNIYYTQYDYSIGNIHH
jgi:hypothetical protein